MRNIAPTAEFKLDVCLRSPLAKVHQGLQHLAVDPILTLCDCFKVNTSSQLVEMGCAILEERSTNVRSLSFLTVQELRTRCFKGSQASSLHGKPKSSRASYYRTGAFHKAVRRTCPCLPGRFSRPGVVVALALGGGQGQNEANPQAPSDALPMVSKSDISGSSEEPATGCGGIVCTQEFGSR